MAKPHGCLPPDLSVVKDELIAQDRGSSIIYGMPRSIVEAGLAESVLPLDEIEPQITGLL